MTSASPTAASAAAIAMEKMATMTPVGFGEAGPNRQNAMKFRFAAASISSIPMRMKIACLRLSAASNPIENSAAETTRQSWSVGVIGLGSARVSRAGFGALAETRFGSSRSRGRDRQHARARTLPRKESRSSSLFLHHQNERADERRGQQEADALERPPVIRHQDFADAFDRERFDCRRDNRYRRCSQNCPNEPREDDNGNQSAAPIKTARLFILTTRQQDREDDQNRDRADVHEHLHQPDEFGAE